MPLTKKEKIEVIKRAIEGDLSLEELLIGYLGFTREAKLLRDHYEAINQVEQETLSRALEALKIELPEE